MKIYHEIREYFATSNELLYFTYARYFIYGVISVVVLFRGSIFFFILIVIIITYINIYGLFRSY